MTEQPQGQPDAGPDDVPAEVPDYLDPDDVGVGPTPLDEDTSEPVSPGDLDDLDAVLTGDDQ